MANRPNYEVGIAFGDDFTVADDALAWQVIDGVRLIDISRGRQSELDRIEAGRAVIVAENADGRFSPENTGSTYYPNVVPMRRLKVLGPGPGFGALFVAANAERLAVGDAGAGDSLKTTGSWSLETWTRFASLPASVMTIVEKGDLRAATNAEYDVRYDNTPNRIVARITDGTAFTSVNADGLGAPATGTVYQIVVRHDADADTLSIVVNNGTVTSVAHTTGGYGATDQAFSLGARGNGADQYLDGVVGRTRFWKGKVLTAAEVTWLYNGGYSRRYNDLGVPGTDGSDLKTNLSASWALKEPSGTREDEHSTRDLTDDINTVLQGVVNPAGEGHLFFGVIERWVPPLRGDDAVVTIEATDLFLRLNRIHMDGAQVEELTGARIGKVLDELTWPASLRDLDNGQSTVPVVTLAEVAALQHIQDVVEVEDGAFYIAPDGKATFKDRHARLLDAVSITSQATFGGASGLPFRPGQYDHGMEHIRNDVRVTRTGGTEQTATNAASIDKYGTQLLRRSSDHYLSDAVALDAARWLLEQRREVVPRLRSIVVEGGSDDSLWTQMFTREIGDRITVVHTFPGAFGLDREFIIEGIRHSIVDGLTRHTTEWLLSAADVPDWFVLDSTTRGILDTNRLAS